MDVSVVVSQQSRLQKPHLGVGGSLEPVTGIFLLGCLCMSRSMCCLLVLGGPPVKEGQVLLPVVLRFVGCSVHAAFLHS